MGSRKGLRTSGEVKTNQWCSSSKLNKQQTIELIVYLEKNTYPSTKEIIQYIQGAYGVSYTQQGMHDWLIKHRFSYKKPKGVPAKFDKLGQEVFIQEYEELKANPSSLARLCCLLTVFTLRKRQKLPVVG